MPPASDASYVPKSPAPAALSTLHSTPDQFAWRAMCEDIVASCEQQQRLIEALLELTDRLRGLRRRQPVDLAAITRQALRAHELRELDRIAALEPAFATGDPTLLERLAAFRTTRLGIPIAC